MHGRDLGSRPWVGFRIDEVDLAVDARLVKAVAWSGGVITVPFSRRAVAGVLVRGGRAVPVLDLALAPAAWNRMPGPGGSHVVIVGEGEMEAGLLVNTAETFQTGDPRPAAGAAITARMREALLEGIIEAAGRTYGVLNVSATLQAAGVPRSFGG